MSSFLKHFVFGAIAMIASCHCALAQNSSSALIPAADFAKRPKYSSIQFSPDGKRFGALQTMDGRANLTIGDLSAGKLARITNFTTYDVSSFAWISDSRLVLSLYDSSKGLAESRGGGLYAINQDGSEPKALSPTGEDCQARMMICRQTWFSRRIPDSEDEVIALSNDRDLHSEDVYRLNTKTGRKVLLTQRSPGRVSEWILDTESVPRAAVSYDGKTRTEVFWYRGSADAPWQKVSTVSGEEPRMRPAAFDTDGSLLVFSNLESDTFKLYEFNATTGKQGKLVVGDPFSDIDNASIVAPASLGFKVVGIRYDSDKPQMVWFDDRYAKLQSLLDASLPKGTVNTFSILDDGNVAVTSRSDRDPGDVYLYHAKEQQLEEVLRPRDWIRPEQMSPMSVVRYKARDGMEIPAYLTLPTGRPPNKLPLVAVIHGGPWARDDWRFNPDVQFLASRGYAVFQPNYRGSDGYGMKHLQAGFKQLGESMQDDITDGVRYLIAQGIVDPARVCIDGGSYGGYATMMALIKEPDMFKCGIDEAGVIDLFWWHELGYTDYNRADAESAEEVLRVRVGDTKADHDLLVKNSPRLHADRVKASVMIIHAVRDHRVPFQHAEAMRDALKAAGKSVEWVVYPDEAHGFIKFENRVDRYNKIEAFLKQNIGQ